MKSIYLLQRCKVNEEKYSSKCKVGDFINLDYMGSTEFELGGFGKGIRHIHENRENYSIFKIKNAKGVMWVYANNEQKEDITKFITAHMFQNHPSDFLTKEFTDIFPQFQKDEELQKSFRNKGDTDFWMDIENFFVFSLKKDHLKKFIKASDNSINHMNTVKKELEECDAFIKKNNAYQKIKELGFEGFLCPQSIYNHTTKYDHWNDFAEKTEYNFFF